MAEDIKRVPFAFAGDPFQTLNPTGFRWDAVQASFHDKLADTLGMNFYGNIELNYRELNLNYRSNKNVVKLCNSIQALRGALFDLRELQPQHTWRLEMDAPLPVWFDIDNPGQWSTLGKEQDITIIVPCMYNEERDFVKSDPRLSEVVRVDESGVPLNVLSPTRAKGLEFGRVVIYGFAENAPANLLELLENNDLSEDDLLPIEYFVNQLYVAASRPKRRLFIIDSHRGMEILWKLGLDDTIQEKVLSQLHRGPEHWREHLGGFQMGTPESWNEDRGNPEENAERYEQQGKTNRDPYMLRSAALIYESIGKNVLAHKCRALALQFESKFLEAGRLYQSAGDSELALKCFWYEGLEAQDDLLKLGEKHPPIAMRLEYKMVHVLNNPRAKTIMDRLRELLEQCDNSDDFCLEFSGTEMYAKIIWRYVDFFIKENVEITEIKEILATLQKLLAHGLSKNPTLMALLYYRAKDYTRSVECWEQTEGYAGRVEYRHAKAVILAEKYEHNPEMTLHPGDIKLLSDYFEQHRNYEKMVQVLTSGSKYPEYYKSLLRVPDAYSDWQKLMLVFLETLSRMGKWEYMLDLATASLHSYRVYTNFSSTVTRFLFIHREEIRNALVITCGSSPEFSQQSTRILKRYAEFFEEILTPNQKWRDTLSVEITGAALERAGMFRMILPFYESIYKDHSFKEKERRFAKLRWIRTKEKQAHREEEGGFAGIAEHHLETALARRRDWHLEKVEIPDFPENPTVWVQPLPSSGNSASKKQALGQKSLKHRLIEEQKKDLKMKTDREKTQQNSNNEKKGSVKPPREEKKKPVEPEKNLAPPAAGEIRRLETSHLIFDYSHELGRINISHRKTMNTAVFRADKQKLESNDVAIIKKGKRFICKEWDCECSISADSEVLRVKFRMTSQHITVEIQLKKGGA